MKICPFSNLGISEVRPLMLAGGKLALQFIPKVFRGDEDTLYRPRFVYGCTVMLEHVLGALVPVKKVVEGSAFPFLCQQFREETHTVRSPQTFFISVIIVGHLTRSLSYTHCQR